MRTDDFKKCNHIADTMISTAISLLIAGTIIYSTIYDMPNFWSLLLITVLGWSFIAAIALLKLSAKYQVKHYDELAEVVSKFNWFGKIAIYFVILPKVLLVSSLSLIMYVLMALFSQKG